MDSPNRVAGSAHPPSPIDPSSSKIKVPPPLDTLEGAVQDFVKARFSQKEHTDLVKHFYANKRPDMTVEDALALTAAENGNIDLLDLLFKKEIKRPNTLESNDLEARVCAQAAKAKRRTVLEWAHARGFHWNERVCKAAAKANDLPTLIWLRERGCDWDEYTPKAAAEKGHLDILKWAKKNGCDCEAHKVINSALRNGHYDLANWALENGISPAWDRVLKNVYFYAKERQTPAYQWIKDNRSDDESD